MEIYLLFLYCNLLPLASKNATKFNRILRRLIRLKKVRLKMNLF